MEKMNKEGWPISFEQLLKATEEGREYVGCGNPNARILIIASEVAISPNEERYKWEISDNNLLWRMEDGIAETIVHDGIIDDISKFSPRFPYKGQKYSVWSEVKKGDVTRIRSIYQEQAGHGIITRN